MLAALAAVLLHALVLKGLPRPSGSTAVAASPPAVRVRALEPAAPAAGPPRPSAPTARPIAAAPAAARSPAAPGRGRTEHPASAGRPGPAEPGVGQGVAPDSTAAAAAATPVASPAGLGDGLEAAPVYATRLAPPQELAYTVRRGLATGHATLSWRVEGPSQPGTAYVLEFVARVGGIAAMTQSSRGEVDAHGLAPQRFTDRRLRSGTQAANFQRERGLIGFSGPSLEHPLWPGVQDRLSWMLQLPAIVEASPALATPGRDITLAVVGARGDAAVWVFRFEGVDTVATAAGEVLALRFVRLPRKPHDTQAEVWLDPAHHHLPVRVRLGNPPDGEVLELLRDTP